MKLRLYQPADLSTLQEIRRAAFAPIFQSFREIAGEQIYQLALTDSDAEQAALLDKLCAENPGLVWVATIDEELAGFVTYSLNNEKKIGEIGLNAVHPRFGGKGIGAQMYRHVLELMKEHGMLIATVGTGGDASHAPARRAYEKVGFGPSIPSVYIYKVL